ncbi:MAG: type II toxin-antitoxin system Phd/YefM family antitoxin [Firmicutes bacterium]|nr:type II toxin-antitoxin system Phd/YefM family antitoxin [Bacillota bacterium]
MEQVGAYDAKTHLSELLDRVAQGDTIIVTKHGRPIAKLVPFREDTLSEETLIARFQKLRSGISPQGLSIREMIDEGRRL